MSDLLADDGIEDIWVVVWFPPDGDRSKAFKGDKAEEKARKWAAREYVAEWNPLLEHRIVTTVSELVPL